MIGLVFRLNSEELKGSRNIIFNLVIMIYNTFFKVRLSQDTHDVFHFEGRVRLISLELLVSLASATVPPYGRQTAYIPG